MAHKARSFAFWTEELAFIVDTHSRGAFTSFNNSRACFDRYCAMQAHCAERDGFQGIADDIRLVALDATLA